MAVDIALIKQSKSRLAHNTIEHDDGLVTGIVYTHSIWMQFELTLHS